MNLDKAIEVNTDLLGESPQYPPEVRRAAVKLGIEALEFFKRFQERSGGFQEARLPSETKE